MDHLFGLHLAPLVIVGEVLSDIGFLLQDASAAEAAHVGGGDMMEMLDVGGEDEVEDIPRAGDV